MLVLVGIIKKFDTWCGCPVWYFHFLYFEACLGWSCLSLYTCKVLPKLLLLNSELLMLITDTFQSFHVIFHYSQSHLMVFSRLQKNSDKMGALKLHASNGGTPYCRYKNLIVLNAEICKYIKSIIWFPPHCWAWDVCILLLWFSTHKALCCYWRCFKDWNWICEAFPLLSSTKLSWGWFWFVQLINKHRACIATRGITGKMKYNSTSEARCKFLSMLLFLLKETKTTSNEETILLKVTVPSPSASAGIWKFLFLQVKLCSAVLLRRHRRDQV